MNKSEQFSKIRNELSYILRFGGICTAIQFNPNNISHDTSINVSPIIIDSINEYMWNRGIDIIYKLCKW